MKTTLESLALTRGAAAAPAPASAERLQMLALVEQFEGMLLTEMLRDIERGDDEEDGALGLGGSTMTDMMRGEFGQSLGRSGGLGLSELLASAFLRQQQAADAALDLGPASNGMVVPIANPANPPVAPHFDGDTEHVPAQALLPIDLVAGGSRVTSGFGLRADPFTGETRFHRGLDLALAYGSDVRAFAPGVVTSAGERPGYGLTVVVDHGEGRETLYAHLSAVDVSPGTAVEAGQPIARSGRSGRATGAHLHVEAREFGRPVDVGRLSAAGAGRADDTGVGASDE